MRSTLKNRLSGLGIIFMLVLKYPPLPDYSIFRKDAIVRIHSLARKKIAMEYLIN